MVEREAARLMAAWASVSAADVAAVVEGVPFRPAVPGGARFVVAVPPTRD
ncbi:hypothetical protein [Nocardia tengchongensis]